LAYGASGASIGGQFCSSFAAPVPGAQPSVQTAVL
jgi:hypothetical protein